MARHNPSRVIIHVGTPKTGTTAIQSAMASSRRGLLRHGICYPTAGIIGHGVHGHHNLAYELNPGANGLKFRRLLGTWSSTAAEARRTRATTVLLSSEAFRAYMARRVAARTADFWEADRIEIVIYLRPQWEYIESGYNQLARFGNIEGETIEQFWARKAKTLGDYRLLVSVWEEHFPQSKVTVLPYTKQRMADGIVRDFDREVLRSGYDFGDMKTVNPKVGMRAISAVQYVKQELRRTSGVSDLPVPRSAIFGIRDLYSGTFQDTADFRFMSSELEGRIATECDAINAWLRARYPLFAEARFGAWEPHPDRQLFEPAEFAGAEREALDAIVRKAR